MNHVAGADDVQEVLRIVGMRGIFHRVQMIEITKELIEAMDGRQKFVLVTEMVLTELTGCVTHRFQNRCNGNRLGGYSDRGTRLTYCGHASADW